MCVCVCVSPSPESGAGVGAGETNKQEGPHLALGWDHMLEEDPSVPVPGLPCTGVATPLLELEIPGERSITSSLSW